MEPLYLSIPLKEPYVTISSIPLKGTPLAAPGLQLRPAAEDLREPGQSRIGAPEFELLPQKGCTLGFRALRVLGFRV